jgi:hypothetical protein
MSIMGSCPQAVDNLLQRTLPAHIAASLHRLQAPRVSPCLPQQVTDALLAAISRAHRADLLPRPSAEAPAVARVCAPQSGQPSPWQGDKDTQQAQDSGSSAEPSTASMRQLSPACSTGRCGNACGTSESEEVAGRACCKALEGDGASEKLNLHGQEWGQGVCAPSTPTAPSLFMDLALFLMTLASLLVSMSR